MVDEVATRSFEVMLRQIKSIKASTGERFVVVVTD